MKPISQLSPEEAQELLFYTSPSGVIVPISKISDLSPDSVTIAGKEYEISQTLYETLLNKLTTYEGVKLMYAQDDLAKQASKLTETSFAANFKEYFEHMNDVIDHINSQATKAIKHLQTTIDSVTSKATSTLSNIDAIERDIKPFKQFAATTNLKDLKDTVKENVEQLVPVKQNLNDVIAHLEKLFSGSKVE